MASFAHVEHPSQHYVTGMAAASETLGGTLKRLGASAARALERWSEAHHQAVQDRLFCELASTDRRLMAELSAIKSHTEAFGTI